MYANTHSEITIRQTYIMMGTMFKSAKMNDLIAKHPMDGVRYTKPVRPASDIKYLTRDEQARFLQVARKSHNYFQYALILETGLRTGESIGLTWDAIDFEKHTSTVSKTLEYRHGQHQNNDGSGMSMSRPNLLSMAFVNLRAIVFRDSSDWKAVCESA